MIRINLHMHSTFSDGVYSPSELVRLLSLHRVAVAALTDHDTVGGVGAFLMACRKRNIRGVAGVEISSRFDNGDELHVLGYRFDPQAQPLNEVFRRYEGSRRARNAAICARLTDLGLPIALEEAEQLAGGGVVGRPHIAQALLNKGRVPTLKDAFDRYLGRGAAAFVPRDLLPTKEVIRIIIEAGGLPVWAHPLKSLSNVDEFPSILDCLKEVGLWGIEYRFHGASSAQVLTCLKEAVQRGLRTTAGTDFHGRAGHSAKISGCVVEDDLLPWARFCGGR